MADRKISELTALTDLDGTEEFVVASAGTTKKISAEDLAGALGGGGVGGSPVDIPPETPDAFDDEFDDSASLSDWTVFGDAYTTEDINTTIPGRLYLFRSAGANSKNSGRYKAIPAFPSTFLVKQGAGAARENYHRGNSVVVLPTGTITDSSPCWEIGQTWADQHMVNWSRMSNLSSFATGGSVGWGQFRPAALYIRISFVNNRSLKAEWSMDGIAWLTILGPGYDPGWDMDKIGWTTTKESGGTYPVQTSIDYFRRIA